MPKKHTIITIDGPSGAGKSTISRMLAKRLGCTFLDTGAMYRAVGLKCQRAGLDEGDTERLSTLLDATDLHLIADGEDTRVILDGEDVSADIRTADMGLVASRFSSLPLVRRKLTELQRRMGEQCSLVAEGRDMGTVVFPDAPFKFYLDASAEERARRRTEQLLLQGQAAACDAILAQIKKRDHDDSSRTLAPLKPAYDAVIIDSSVLSIEEVLARMEEVVKRGNRAGRILNRRKRTMREERNLKRRHLIYYLEVFNDKTGEQLGHLVDITTKGMKIISKQPLPIDESFTLRMVLPKGYFPEPVVHFSGISRWVGKDVNPDFHVIGFEVNDLDPEVRKVVVKLITWLGFND